MPEIQVGCQRPNLVARSALIIEGSVFVASRCVNCGGELRYDIGLQRVKCQHCDSNFDPETFVIKTAAEEVEDFTQEKEREKQKKAAELTNQHQYATTIYVCPNCGAEISCDSLDAVNYCLYCGSFVTLESQMGVIRKPDVIIPFAQTMENCKEAYRKTVKWKLYAPSEFRDEKFIEGFKGIYIPFWNFRYSYGPEITIRGKDETRDGDYKNVQYYATKAKASGSVDNLAYDASSSFDDNISMSIAPFNTDKMKAFNPAYMFGFFGDTADIDKDIYQKDADLETKQQIWEQVTGDKRVDRGHPESEAPEAMEQDFNLQKQSLMAMLPVWFLTWRKGDRLAYSVMNGDTGEVYTEIPVSTWRYIFFSLLTAVPIFFGLNQVVTLMADEMLWWSMGLAFLMILMYVIELDHIVRRVMHTDDRGFLVKDPELAKANEQVSPNIITDVLTAISELTLFDWGVVIVAFIICCFSMLEAVGIGLIVVIFGTPIYTFMRLYQNAALLKDWTVWLDIFPAIFAIMFSAYMLIKDPAPDLYYYGCAMLCMASVGLAAIRMVSRYNDMITRPLPRFFSRKEGRLK